MTTFDEQTTLQMAREALRQGDKAAGRRLLQQVLGANRNNEAAWLMLSAAVDDSDQERDCLRQVLRINPANQVARRHLDVLTDDRLLDTPAPAPVPAPTPTSVATPKPRGRGLWWKLPILFIGGGALLCVFLMSWLNQPDAARQIKFAYETNCSYISSLSDWRCEGVVENVGDRSVRYIQIRATILDAAGQQVGTDWTYADSDVLAPGGTSGFTVYVSDPYGGYGRGRDFRITIEDARY